MSDTYSRESTPRQRRQGTRRRQNNETFDAEQFIYEQEVENFYDLAERYDITPEQLAGVVITNISPEDQFDYYYDQFEKDVKDFYGKQVGREALLDQETAGTLFNTWATKRKFEAWRTEWPVQLGPDTIMQTLSLPEAQNRAAAEMMEIAFGLYGDEFTAVALQTALIQDPEQRDATWKLIEQFSQPDYIARGRGAPDPSIASSQDLLQKVLLDPSSFDTLPADQQQDVIFAARQVLEEKVQVEELEQSQDFSDSMQRGAKMMLTPEGYDIQLDDREQKMLQDLVSSLPTNEDYSLKNTDFFTTDVDVSAQVGELGITAYRDTGHVPHFTFDPTWAKENFETHAAVRRYLQSIHPTATFQYGENDAIADVFALLGRTTDDISSWVGAFFTNTQEGFEEVGFRTGLYKETREYWANEEIRVRNLIENGAVSEGELNAAMSYMFEAQDKAHADYGLGDYMNDVRRLADTPEFGTAFGDAATEAFAVYPGDTEYDFVNAVGTLAGQLLFDPTILLAKPLKAFRLSGITPAGAKISKSAVTQTLFDWMAMPPEVLMGTRRGAQFAERLTTVAKFYDTPEDFAVTIARTMGIDHKTSLGLARLAKTSPEELHLGIMSAWGGDNLKVNDEARILTHIDESSRFLEYVDKALPAQIKSIKAKIKRRQANVAKLPRGFQVEIADDGTVTLRGWHGRDSNLLPVNIKEADLNGGAFHFGTYDAAVERLDNRGIQPNAPWKVVDEDGHAFFTAWTEEDAKKIVAERNRAIRDKYNKQLEGTGLSVDDSDIDYWRYEENTTDIMPLEIQGKFLGAETIKSVPFSDWDATMLTTSDSFRLNDPMRVEQMTPRAKAILKEAVLNGKTPKQHLMDLGFDGVVYVNNFEDSGSVSAAVFDMAKVSRLDDELQFLLKEADRVTATRAEALARRSDAIADKLYYEDVLKAGSFEPITPLRRLPSNKQLRNLGPATTRYGRVWEGLTQLGKEFPQALLDTLGAGDMARYLKSRPMVDKLAARVMASIGRWGRDVGAGNRLWFLTDDLPEGSLIDEVDRSYKHLDDFGTYIGADRRVIDETLADILRAANKKSRPEIYTAFVEGYTRMIDSSSVLTEVGRNALKNIWPELAGERTAGMVRTGRGVHARSKATLSVPKLGESGNVTRSGMPAIEADMLHGLPLPSVDQVRDHLSMVRSTMNGFREAGKLKRGVAGTYFMTTEIWRGFNAAWARAVLLGRMPFALPLRIQMEQAVRIEAYGHASILRHPVEWFKALKGWDEFALFAESPAYALGVITRDWLDDAVGRLARRGRQIVNLDEDTPAMMKALAGRMKAYNASPSMRVLADFKLTNKQALAKIQETPYFWNTYQPIWDDIIEKNLALGGEFTSYEKIIASVRREIKQVIGTGPGAKKLLAAIRSGRMEVFDEIAEEVGSVSTAARRKVVSPSGRIVTEDGNDFADELLRMYKSNEWKPDVFEFPRAWGDYLPLSKENAYLQLKRASDWMFNTFYSRPDLYFGRSPLFRQIAAKEFSRLRSLGVAPGRAEEMARVYGARQTADVLFTIGANTSADYWIRSVMPFFPAWKELATTWLAKIPAHVGGGGVGGWVVGAPAVASRIEAYMEFFQDTGIIEKQGDQWRIKFGVMSPIVKAFTGLDVDSVSASADSMTSLLPTPSLDEDDPFYKGMLPTVGAPTGQVLHVLSEKYGGFFERLENDLTLFGGNQSLGPASVDYVLEAFGITAPWLLGSEESHKIRRNSAFIDALRMKYEEHYDSKPVRSSYKTDDEYAKAEAEWLENIYAEAERGSKNWYILRGISSLVLPFSIKYDDDAATELNAMWDVINEVENHIDDAGVATPMLEGFRTAYPELELYLTGKTTSMVPDDPERVDTYETFLKEIEEGKRLAFTPEQWLVWAIGNQEAALHRSRLNEIFDSFTHSPQQWLLSGYDSAQALTEENIRWERYLDTTELLANHLDVKTEDGHPTSFKQMYQSFYDAELERYGDGKTVSLTFQQEQASKALDALRNLSKHFGSTGYSDDSYGDVRRTLNDILGDQTYTSKDPTFAAVGWWWDQMQPYFDEKDRLWRLIDDSESFDKPPLYRKLQQLENEWATKTISHSKYGRMPQVQEVLFNKLSPDDQELKLFEWAKLPVEFLSQYQRIAVYGKTKHENRLDQLVGVIHRNEARLDEYLNRNAINPSTKEAESLRARVERMNADAAKEMGVYREYVAWSQPAYRHVDALVEDNPYWDELVKAIDQGAANLARFDLTPRSTTPAGVAYQRSIITIIEDMRRRSDEFDDLMTVLEKAYGESVDRPANGVDMYWPLFFGGSTAFIPGYLNY